MKFLIDSNKTIFDALVEIDKISAESQTLFVIDDLCRLQGSLSDGDIRRFLITGGSIYDKVSSAMYCNCAFLFEGDEELVAKLRQLRDNKKTLVPICDKELHVIDIINLEKLKSSLPVDAVLMAGGKGERLRPLTQTMPKPLVKVGNKAIIDYNVERLISYGVKDINVTINYLGEQLEEHFSNPINGVKVGCVREPQYLGTIGSIQFVKEFHNDTILVMNSDLFTNIDYEDFYLHFKEHNADMSVAAVPYDVSVPFGIFELDGRNITGINEKPTYHYYANAGIYLFKKDMLKYVPENKFFNATDFIEELVKQRMRVVRFPITGYWIDIGQYSELEKATELVKHITL